MEAADVILMNGCIHTMDAALRVVAAVAVKEGRIVYVGDDDGVRALIGPATDVIDLAGKMTLPGFIDSHMHIPEGAVLPLHEVRLPEGLPVGEYIPTIRAFAQANPGLAAIRGIGWDDSLFTSSGPSAAMLDEAVPDRPAVIRSGSLHSSWCNTKALQMAGITRDTPEPPHGIIEKDPTTGEPAGTLHESAQELVISKLPDYSVEQYVAALDHFQKTVSAPLGITTCFDARLTPKLGNAMEAFALLEREGRLNVRVRGAFLIDPLDPLEPQLAQAAATRARYQDPLFQVNAVKFFADGSGLSIFLEEPFSSLPPSFPEGYRGYPGWDPETMAAAVVESAKLGFQLHIHAIGDAAVRISLDAIEAAEQALGRNDIRPAIIHLFLVNEQDRRRLADLNVVAVVQPVWMQRDPFYYQGYLPTLGEARCDRMFPLKSFFDRGVLVTSSTDFPIVNPPSPLDGIAIGVLRWSPGVSAPGDVWAPDERADVRQMIRSYTINGAEALFLENETGSIEIGKSADLVVLNENLFDIPAETIGFSWRGSGTAKVLMTMFQGRTVYQADEMN